MDDNIFDDVDAILDEESTSTEDKNFNDSELQDIMSEIENLEKEFVVETSPMSLQEKIDAELDREMSTAQVETVVEAVRETPKEAPIKTVLTFEKPMAVVPVATPASTSSEVSFAAHGQMSFNLDFKVGQDTAKLVVDPLKGLIVTISGVELCINEDSGCTVSMENGMTFTIPLSSQNKSLKKKAA